MTQEPNEIPDVVIRARRAVKSTGMRQKDFAAKLDVHPAHLSAVLNGHEVLTSKMIDLISAYSGVNKEWVLRGEGDMFALTPLAAPATNPLQSLPGNMIFSRFPELNQVIEAACGIWKDLDPTERHRLAMQMMDDLNKK